MFRMQKIRNQSITKFLRQSSTLQLNELFHESVHKSTSHDDTSESLYEPLHEFNELSKSFQSDKYDGEKQKFKWWLKLRCEWNKW